MFIPFGDGLIRGNVPCFVPEAEPGIDAAQLAVSEREPDTSTAQLAVSEREPDTSTAQLAVFDLSAADADDPEPPDLSLEIGDIAGMESDVSDEEIERLDALLSS